MMKIDPARTDLAREFREHPFGPHSTDLRRLLSIFRDGSAREKTMIATCDGGYCLARVAPRRGDPIRYESDRVFAHLGEALWAVFQARWEQATGSKPALD